MLNHYEKRLLGILLAITALGVIMYGGDFWSVTTMIIIANQLPEYGLLAMALMSTLIISGLNLSIVAMATLSGISGAIVMVHLGQFGGASILIGILVMLLVGLLTGAVNGVIVSYLNVSPILVSLGTMLFFKGIALNMTKGGAITSFDDRFVNIGLGRILGIPLPLLILIAAVIGLNVLLSQSSFGHQLYRIGKNKVSAIYSGIDVSRIVLQAYMISGILAGMAGVVMTARYNSIRVDYGSTYLINCITVVSLGGVDLEGGRGTVKGVVLALLIVSMVLRILNLAYVDSNLTEAIMGGILLLNLLVQHLTKKEKVSVKI